MGKNLASWQPLSHHTCFLSKEFSNTYAKEGGRHVHTSQPTHPMTSRPRVRERREGSIPPQLPQSVAAHCAPPSVHTSDLSGTLVFKENIFHTHQPPHTSQLPVWCSKKVQCVPTLQAKQAVLASLTDRAWASNVGLSKETIKVNF